MFSRIHLPFISRTGPQIVATRTIFIQVGRDLMLYCDAMAAGSHVRLAHINPLHVRSVHMISN